MGFPNKCVLALGLLSALTNSHSIEKRQAGFLRITPSGKMTVASGKNSFFTCKADVPNPELVRDLTWFAPDGRRIPEDDRVYTEELPGDAAIMLFIKNIREADQGKYKCKGVYANNDQMEADIEIETFIDITWDDAPVEQNAVINTDYKIRCVVRAQPPATIDWLKEDLIVSTGDRYVVETDGLLIKEVTSQDAGTYTCRARVAETGTLQERDIKMEVQVPPGWIEQPISVEGIEQDVAKFYCDAAGTPSPTYTWVNWEGINVLDKEGWVIKKDAGELTTGQLRREDAGEYTCIAENPAGRIEAKARLDVIIKPKVQELYNKTMPVRTPNGKIVCKASGDPLPEIIWRKWSSSKPFIPGGQPLDERIYVKNTVERAPDYTEGEEQWAVSEISISQIERKDDGLYECQARNKGGQFFKSGHLQVEFGPTFEETPMTDEWSWDQNPINLTCIATAIPNATITWWIRDREIGREELNRNYQIIGNGPRSDLKITPLNLEFYGRYTCKAKNPHGEAQHEIELHEAREPSFVQQAVTDKITATTIQFRFVAPTDTGGLPIESYAAEYKESTKQWSDATRRLWPASDEGVYILETLHPRTTYDFRFAAKNLVGYSQWGASQQFTMPQRGPPEPPRIDLEGRELVNDVLNITKPTEYELSWFLPEDNGEPIDYFEVSFFPVAYNTETLTWTDRGNLFRTEIPHGNVRYTLKGLFADTYHMVELRAHNHLGFSRPSAIVVKTAQADGLEKWHVSRASVPIEVIIGVIVLLLLIGCILVDFVRCQLNHGGLILCCWNKIRGATRSKKQNAQKRVPPVVCTEKRLPPGIKEKQQIMGTQEQDPLLNGGKRETVVSMQKNGNNVSLNNSRDVVV